jgi:hypothetical protein
MSGCLVAVPPRRYAGFVSTAAPAPSTFRRAWEDFKKLVHAKAWTQFASAVAGGIVGGLVKGDILGILLLALAGWVALLLIYFIWSLIWAPSRQRISDLERKHGEATAERDRLLQELPKLDKQRDEVAEKAEAMGKRLAAIEAQRAGRLAVAKKFLDGWAVRMRRFAQSSTIQGDSIYAAMDECKAGVRKICGDYEGENFERIFPRMDVIAGVANQHDGTETDVFYTRTADLGPVAEWLHKKAVSITEAELHPDFAGLSEESPHPQ